MTEEEKSSGKPWDGSGSDWFSLRTMKTLLIKQSVTCENNVQLVRKRKSLQREVGAKKKELWNRDSCAAKQFTELQPWANPPKNRLTRLRKNFCRCCNSPPSNIYDRIHVYGKTAEKENLVEKLKDIRGIEVLTGGRWRLSSNYDLPKVVQKDHWSHQASV